MMTTVVDPSSFLRAYGETGYDNKFYLKVELKGRAMPFSWTCQSSEESVKKLELIKDKLDKYYSDINSKLFSEGTDLEDSELPEDSITPPRETLP